jgi:hypothetical protein
VNKNKKISYNLKGTRYATTQQQEQEPFSTASTPASETVSPRINQTLLIRSVGEVADFLLTGAACGRERRFWK